MCVCCSVLDIIDLFEHPVVELRQAVEKTLNDFNLSDPYWQVAACSQRPLLAGRRLVSRLYWQVDV